MALEKNLPLLFLTTLLLIICLADGSAVAPTVAVDCSSQMMNLADCLSFVTNGSTTTKPEGKCCSGLKTVLKTSPVCLCEGFKSSAQLGVVLNISKAMTLPKVCHLSAPPVNNCGLAIVPGAAPVVAPVLAPTSAASSPTVGSGSANERTPVLSPGSSGAEMFSISGIYLMVGLVIACLYM